MLGAKVKIRTESSLATALRSTSTAYQNAECGIDLSFAQQKAPFSIITPNHFNEYKYT